MPYINSNPYNTPLPYNPPGPPSPPPVVPTPNGDQYYAGPQHPPKGPYGKLTNDGYLINYVGLASDTTETIIDNVNRTIKVNVYKRLLEGKVYTLDRDPSISDLKEGEVWYNTEDHVLRYFDGTKIVNVQTELKYLSDDDIDNVWDNQEGEYSDKVLKGKELEYYTRKLQRTLDQMSHETEYEIERLDERIDDLDDLKLQLEMVADTVETTYYSYRDKDYPTKDAAYVDLISRDPGTGKYVFEDKEYDTIEEAQVAVDIALDEREKVTGLVNKDGEIISPDAIKEDLRPKANRLYLVPGHKGDPSTHTIEPNYCNEYIWNVDRNEFELVGSTDIDLEELTNHDIDNIWNEVFTPSEAPYKDKILKGEQLQYYTNLLKSQFIDLKVSVDSNDETVGILEVVKKF